MRRWFKLNFTDDAGWFDSAPRSDNDDAVFISMPYVAELVEILNRAANVKAMFYSGDGSLNACIGAPDFCQHEPVQLCTGGVDPTPHTYVPQHGSFVHDFRPTDDETPHIFIPYGDVNLIAAYTLISCLIAGFPDTNGDRAPILLRESFDGPPSKNG